jgi:hypothetical protein
MWLRSVACVSMKRAVDLPCSIATNSLSLKRQIDITNSVFYFYLSHANTQYKLNQLTTRLLRYSHCRYTSTKMARHSPVSPQSEWQEWVIAIIFIVLFPIMIVYDLVRHLFDLVVPKPLRWVWDDGSGNMETRRRIDTWGDIYFPPDFLWGTATAAHQVEGDCKNNQWWKFEQEVDPRTNKPRILKNQKSKKACDHWNRVGEDVSIMKDLGCNSYRFSVEWSKLEPSEGVWDASVFKHYHDEIDELLRNGVTPMITLFHFSHPMWFDEKGAWEDIDNLRYFVRFSTKVFEEYGHKVKLWCTINEPEVFSSCGFIQGKDCFLSISLGWLLKRSLTSCSVQESFPLE